MLEVGRRSLRIYFFIEARDRGVSRGSGRASCAKRGECEQGREMACCRSTGNAGQSSRIRGNACCVR